jgi:hypothetical protein
MVIDPVLQAFLELDDWCRQRNFSGYDPFDALNSQLFQSLPFKNSPAARLMWTQLVKRSPVDLRRITHVVPGQNAKGIALFALAALANYRRAQSDEAETRVRALLQQLISLRISGCTGAAWGYNFDWQSRVFFAARSTPTIVPTAFAARAFIEAHHAFEDEEYLRIARETCDFVLTDLPRTVNTQDEVCFGYKPGSTDRIYNASLLAAETLSSVASLTKEAELCELSIRAARYVIGAQRSDGLWTYGTDERQSWVDSFHTAFILGSLNRIIKDCNAQSLEGFQRALNRGYEFWRKSFFLADGWPKYYDDSPYPADAHSAATAIATLCDLREIDDGALALAEQIANWSIDNLRDPSGFFYYQRRRFYTVRTPFMRWSQAWMLYGLSRLLEEKYKTRAKTGVA